MSAPERPSRSIKILLLACLFGSISVATAIEASAQRFGGGFGRFSGGGMMAAGPRTSGFAQGRRFNPNGMAMPRARGARAVANGPYPGSAGIGRTPGRYPGRYPGRNPGRWPGGTGVAIGTGVGIGVGVIVGNGSAGAAPPPPPSIAAGGAPQAPRNTNRGINIPPHDEQRFVPNEVVLEFNATLSPAAITRLTARHRLLSLEQQNFPLTNTTYLRARITDGRSVRTVLRQLGREVDLRSGQPNYLYRLSQQSPAEAPAATPANAALADAPPEGDPAQYALAKMHLPEAHRLTRGETILVAVIDSGVDAGHPELQGAIAETFDALGKMEKPHPHGTAIVGAIVAHAKLMGIAPSARILAIRAFGVAGTSAEATSYAILKGLDYAAGQGARVVNMSFAGPSDPALSLHLASAHERGIVLVAASGNFGPTSPPQYPAADPNVIAVTATDANDGLFKAANRGNHIAIAAPGVGILLPAPNADYQVTSGTSFAAAHISGIVALLLAKQPSLSPEAIRQILVSTATDLGPAGKDEQFGAGLADAYRALQALDPQPVAAQPATTQAQR